MGANLNAEPDQAAYMTALRRYGWVPMNELPDLHDALQPAAALLNHLHEQQSAMTFEHEAIVTGAGTKAKISQQCWVLQDLTRPVHASDELYLQPPNPTGWWFVDLGPLDYVAMPTLYRAFRSIDPTAVPPEGTIPWTILRFDKTVGSHEEPGQQKQAILAAMGVKRTIYPWGVQRVFAKRYPKDKDGHWVYHHSGTVQVSIDWTGVPTQATPSVEIIVTEYGPTPTGPNATALMGQQPTLRTGRIKLDYIKSLGEGREAILEITEKCHELAALVRIAMTEPTRAGELVTALTDDRYDPPRPGQTSLAQVVLRICEASDVLDLFEQLTY